MTQLDLQSILDNGVVASLIAGIIIELCRYAHRHGLIQNIFAGALFIIKRVQLWAAAIFKIFSDYVKLQFLLLSMYCRLASQTFHLTVKFVCFLFADTLGLLKVKGVAFVLLFAIVSQMQETLVKQPEPQLPGAENIAFESRYSDEDYKLRNRPVRLKKSPPGVWSYRITDDWDTRTGTLELFRNNQPIFVTQRGDYLTVFRFDEGQEAIDNPGSDNIFSGELQTEDITGDGIPDLLLLIQSSGTSGYREYSLLSLGEKVKEIYSQSDCGADLRFEDLDGDDRYEAVTEDFTLVTGYVGAIHPTGPAINVILKHEDTGFLFSTNLMRKPGPTEAELYAEARRAIEKRAREVRVTDDTYAYILNLVYGGNGELARRFVHLIFPDITPGEREFYWYSLFGKMSNSPYWTEIAALNNWKPDQYFFEECPY